jgi:hypothetical protein
MSKRHQLYLFLIALHLGIGFVIFLVPLLSKLYAFAMLLGGMLWIFKNKNAGHEAIIASAYIVGSEVFLRMTSGNPIYEFSKYTVILFLLMGVYYRGFSKHALPYWLYMFFLVPGIVVAVYSVDYGTDILKMLSFNISGPVCLGVSSFYAYRRNFTMTDMGRVLLACGLPVLSCATYLYFYTPDIQESLTGTSSNFALSGGFGPNQVSTILGLGMFVFVARSFFDSPTKIIMLVNLGVAMIIGYRGLITFSRGGMITAVLMLLILAGGTYLNVNGNGKKKLVTLMSVLMGGIFAVWLYSSIQTGGLIDKRYANQDAAGRTKESRFTGREHISATEIEYFLRHPWFGIGAGKGSQIRKAETGATVLSHNELTRMLGEHGLFGILCLLILLFTPIALYMDNRENVYLICFLVFWMATINHAAMRTAAPAFIYSLSLFKISVRDASPVRRQQAFS